MSENSRQRRNRHHSVPQRYLERFAAEDGRLWIYARDGEQPNHTHPRNAGLEKYLYAPEAGENRFDDSLELWLADNIDGPAVLPTQKLIDGEDLSQEDRAIMSLYLAVQEQRIPRMRDSVNKFVMDNLRMMARMYASHPDALRTRLRELGEQLPDDEFDELCSDFAAGKLGVQPTKATWLESMLPVAEGAAEIIHSLFWVVLVAPDRFQFVTSDAPVVKVLTDRSVPKRFAGGWLSPSTEASFPLSPTHMLVIHQHPFEGRVSLRKTSQAREFNSRTVRHARRFVYAREREAFISQLLNGSQPRR